MLYGIGKTVISRMFQSLGPTSLMQLALMLLCRDITCIFELCLVLMMVNITIKDEANRSGNRWFNMEASGLQFIQIETR